MHAGTRTKVRSRRRRSSARPGMGGGKRERMIDLSLCDDPTHFCSQPGKRQTTTVSSLLLARAFKAVPHIKKGSQKECKRSGYCHIMPMRASLQEQSYGIKGKESRTVLWYSQISSSFFSSIPVVCVSFLSPSYLSHLLLLHPHSTLPKPACRHVNVTTTVGNYISASVRWHPSLYK